MRRLLQKGKETLLIRYLFVGGASYAVELSLLLILVHTFHQSQTAGEAIAYWVGLGLAFILQKLVAFQNYQREIKALSRQGAIYAVLTLWNYVFTLAFMGHFDQRYLIYTRTVALIIMSFWNYFLYKRFIFGSRAPMAV